MAALRVVHATEEEKTFFTHQDSDTTIRDESVSTLYSSVTIKIKENTSTKRIYINLFAEKRDLQAIGNFLLNKNVTITKDIYVSIYGSQKNIVLIGEKKGFTIYFGEEKDAQTFYNKIDEIKKKIPEENKEVPPDDTADMVNKMKKAIGSAFIVLALVGVAFLGYRLLKKRKRKKPS